MVRAPCLCVTESPGWTGFADNEGSLLVSRRAGVIGDLEQGLSFQSPLPCWFIFHSFLFFKKTFICIYFWGWHLFLGCFYFLSFFQGIFFLLYDLLFWFRDSLFFLQCGSSPCGRESSA